MDAPDTFTHASGGRIEGAGIEREGIGGLVERCPGEDRVGVVAARADDGVVAVGQRGAGDGTLHAGIPGRESAAPKARQEIGAVEATAPGNGGGIWLKNKNVTIIGPTL